MSDRGITESVVEQATHHFSPDQHTARIGFQVVVAAADDLARAQAVITGEATP